MTDTELTPEEQKYFESHGEAGLETEEVVAEEQPEENEPEGGAADEAQGVEDEEKEPKTVPIQAVHEARDEAKRLKEQLAEREAAYNKLTGRLDILESLAKKPEGEETPSYDWDEAPLDAGKNLTEDVTQIKQRLAAEEQMRHLQSAVVARENEFRKVNPDYNDAISHLTATRQRELELFGATPEQIQQQITFEAQQLAVSALQSGRNPAEVAYNLSVQRGYAKKEAEKPQEKPKVDVAKQLDAIERGEQAGRSVSGAGSPQPKSTLDAIMDMDDAEFASLTERDWHKIWQ